MFLAGCGRESAYQRPLTPVKAERVRSYDTGSTVRYSGNVDANSHVDLAFRVGGFVDFIQTVNGRLLQDGDAVTKGEELARLRVADYQARLDQAKSSSEQARGGIEQIRHALAAAQAGRDKAQLDLNRASALFAKQSLIKPDYDAAKAQFDAAQANFEAVQAQVRIAEARLNGADAQLTEGDLALRDTSLRAPLDGIVLKRLVEPGSLVTPGASAFALIDISSVKVIFGAPDHLLPKLRLGMRLPVSTEAIPGARYTGTVSKIAPSADPRSRVFDVELSLRNPGLHLKPGMIATIEAEDSAVRGRVPGLPLTAILKSPTDPNSYSVFIVETADGKSRIHSRNVDLGDSVQDHVAVRGGVREGEMIVTSGTTLVHDGDEVQVIP